MSYECSREEILEMALLSLFNAAVDEYDLDAEELIEKAKAEILGKQSSRLYSGHDNYREVCDELSDLLEDGEENDSDSYSY